MPLSRETRRSRAVHFAFASTLSLTAASLGAGACSGGSSTVSRGAPVPDPLGATDGAVGTTGDDDGGPTTPVVPFEVDTPYTYVAKAKNILVGLPPTDDEMKTVVGAADPKSALQTLMKSWMTQVDPNDPEGRTYYVEKMLAFFMQATQQTQISITDFTDQSYPAVLDSNNKNAQLLVQNAIESFARTMITELVTGSQPTTQVATTTSFEMTTALMETYGWIDEWQVNDDGSTTDAFSKAFPEQQLTVGSAPVAIADSVDATNPATFMHFTDPDVAAGGAYSQVKNLGAGCATDPIVYNADGLNIQGHKVGTVTCSMFGGTAAAAIIGNASSGGASDFSDWRMVTIRAPKAGEATTAFYDLPTLRTAKTLVLNLPRTGFFTTPAFFANWQTNTSNTMRVTMNQTLIVALGAMYDGADSTATPPGDGGMPPGFDPAHDQGACFSCHRLLDPGRSLLASTYSWNYHAQDTAAYSEVPGVFAFQGVTAYPTTVFDLAKTLTTHPLFAQAWVQKLCYYANSQACETSDPEFQRIVSEFTNDSYSWNDLVVDILSSPLTTNAVATQTTTDKGAVVAVSRLGHFCAALNFRLGFSDVCGLLPTTVPLSKPIVEVAGGLPSDGYGRGSPAPVLPNVPSLFYRAGTENICEAVAQLVIDPSTSIPNVKTWSSASAASVAQAEQDFVQTLMAIVPSDPRYAPALALLQAHYTAALAAVDPVSDASDFKPTAALQSVFVAACLAPSAVAIGM
jgi:hypothetical protein